MPEPVMVPATQAGELADGGFRVSEAAGGLLEQLGGPALPPGMADP
jgi:hypothetical protein